MKYPDVDPPEGRGVVMMVVIILVVLFTGLMITIGYSIKEKKQNDQIIINTELPKS